MRWLLNAAVAALFAATGCGLTEVCTADLRPALRVRLVDAATGSPVEGNVAVIATEGSFRDSVSMPQVPPGSPRWAYLAFERLGTYRVEVRAPGYAPWVEPAVRVTDGGCHVETVDLIARLEKTD